MTMEGSPCPSSAYDYAYAKTSKLTERLLISRVGMRCDEISTGNLGDTASRNQQNHDLMNSDHLQFTLIKIARIQKTPV